MCGVLVQISLKLWFLWQQTAPIELYLEKWRHHVFSKVFDLVLFILAGKDDMHETLDELKFGRIRPRTTELAALEHMKKIA